MQASTPQPEAESTLLIWALRAYENASDFLTNPSSSWHSATYAMTVEQLPLGGFAVQDGSFEAVVRLRVASDSYEAKAALGNRTVPRVPGE